MGYWQLPCTLVNLGLITEKLNLRTFIFLSPSTSRARVRCTFCSPLS